MKIEAVKQEIEALKHYVMIYSLIELFICLNPSAILQDWPSPMVLKMNYNIPPIRGVASKEN